VGVSQDMAVSQTSSMTRRTSY